MGLVIMDMVLDLILPTWEVVIQVCHKINLLYNPGNSIKALVEGWINISKVSNKEMTAKTNMGESQSKQF